MQLQAAQLQAKSEKLHFCLFLLGVLLCACQTTDWNFGFWIPEDLEILLYYLFLSVNFRFSEYWGMLWHSNEVC